MFDLNVNELDRHVYETELKDFLPDRFFDFHTHVYKAAFNADISHNGGSSWIDLVADELPAEDLFRTYRELFPDKEVTPLVFGGCLTDLGRNNRYVRDMKERYGFPALFRSGYDMPADRLEEEVRKGGFLGLKPYLTNCPPYIPSKEVRIFDFLPHEHLKAADRNGWIVMLHIPRDGRLRDPVNLAQLLEIEEKYPNVKLIVAHIGRAYAPEDIGNAFDLLGRTKNMCFDFTANLSPDAIRACLKAVGPRRLLFGSDLPIAIMRMYRVTEDGVYYNVVPRGLYGDVSHEAHMRESDETDITLMIYQQIRVFRQCAAELRLRDSDIEDVFCNNAQRLIGSVRP